jgi:hypothetical protein
MMYDVNSGWVRAVIAEQMLDNLREYLGNRLLEDESPFMLTREDVQFLLDMTAMPVKEVKAWNMTTP